MSAPSTPPDEVALSPLGGGLLVCGAAGMLGRAVVAGASAAQWELHAVGRAELDITDSRAVGDLLASLRPAAVINCAAWTDVDGAEADAEGAHAVNATGAEHLARAAAEVGARLVHLSTDYVFDGAGRRPYVESDPTGPRSVYGASKLAGERAVLSASPRHAVVRTSWLFGAGGRNFVDTMLRLAEDGRMQVSVVTDQLGCPTWTGHLAPALLQVAVAGIEGVVHVAGGGEATWNQLAREVFAQAGVEVNVLPSTTVEQDRPAPRPAYSVLRSERQRVPLLAPWPLGVRGHLAARRRGLAAAGTGGRE